MPAHTPDAVLIAASVADPHRFSAVYERHLDAIVRYLARRVGSQLAEDLAAEVFVRAFRARESFTARYETALPWLLGIANHLVGDHRRAERRRLAALQRIVAAEPSVAVAELGGLSADLVRCLRRLPSIDRDALLLVVWGELTYGEAAMALDVPIGTVRSRIARARARLSRALGEQPGSAEPDPVMKGELNA
jgi:RNA polymerase sigma-70 factor (ECF subfamily)